MVRSLIKFDQNTLKSRSVVSFKPDGAITISLDRSVKNQTLPKSCS